MTLPQPIADAPEFWLGRIREVAQLERSGKLTKAQGMNRIRQVLQEMEEYDYRKNLRAAALVNGSKA